MENASKALLIAGAVLIVIVLISVGMLIVSQASGVTDQVGELTTSQATQTFNEQFSKYTGTQKGSSVKSLLQAIATSNATAANNSGKLVSVTIVDTKNNNAALTNVTATNTINAKLAQISNSAKYLVDLSGTDAEGYINVITITRQ